MQVITENGEGIFIAAAAKLADAIIACNRAKGHCALGIVGGRSIPVLLDKLLPYGAALGKIDVFWLDERVEADKNFIPVLPYLERLHTEGVDIRWHPLQSTHKQTIEVEAHQAMRALHELKGAPAFDVVVASAGEDGHVASLFPHHPTLGHTRPAYLLEEHAPKAPPLRITVSAPLLTTAGEAIVFFVDKPEAYRRFLDHSVSIEECPVKLLLQVPKLTVFVTP
jgi:6-phosphogluconolactonase